VGIIDLVVKDRIGLSERQQLIYGNIMHKPQQRTTMITHCDFLKYGMADKK